MLKPTFGYILRFFEHFKAILASGEVQPAIDRDGRARDEAALLGEAAGLRRGGEAAEHGQDARLPGRGQRGDRRAHGAARMHPEKLLPNFVCVVQSYSHNRLVVRRKVSDHDTALKLP